MNSPFEPPSSSRHFLSWKVALLLAVLPGGGHVYLGYPRRGLLHLMSIGALMALLSANIVGRIEPFFTLLLLFVVLHNFLDAYRIAVVRAEAVALELRPPSEGPAALGRGGEAVLGLMFIVGGTLGLLHLHVGLDLTRVLAWWPLAPIGLGAGLVVQALPERHR
jgi:hypothetical protein